MRLALLYPKVCLANHTNPSTVGLREETTEHRCRKHERPLEAAETKQIRNTMDGEISGTPKVKVKRDQHSC